MLNNMKAHVSCNIILFAAILEHLRKTLSTSASVVGTHVCSEESTFFRQGSSCISKVNANDVNMSFQSASHFSPVGIINIPHKKKILDLH